MTILSQIFLNKIFQAGVFSWVIVNALKIIIYYLKNKKVDFSLAIKTGNMPSSHTATITGIATMLYFKEGFSDLFFFAVFLAIFIIYDSVTLRKQVGEHSLVIREMLKNRIFLEVNKKYKITKYLGHNIIEVFFGFIVGLIVAVGVAYVL